MFSLHVVLSCNPVEVQPFTEFNVENSNFFLAFKIIYNLICYWPFLYLFFCEMRPFTNTNILYSRFFCSLTDLKLITGQGKRTIVATRLPPVFVCTINKSVLPD